MFKLPEFPSIDFSSLDLSKFDINELRKVDFSKFVPNIDLSAIDTDKLTAAVRDAAYITVGFGVLAVQKAQDVRHELVRTISDRFGASKPYVEKLLGTFEAGLARYDEQVAAVEARVDTVVDKIGDILPEQAGALLEQARDFTKDARKQVRELLRTAA